MFYIKILPIVCYRNYLYSPKTWLHINKKNKVLFFFLFMLILPYIQLKLLLICYIYILVLLIVLKLPKKIIYSIFKPILIFILFFILFYFFNLTDLNYYKVKDFIIISIPKFGILKSIQMRSLLNKTPNLIFRLVLPEFIIRSISIFFVYIISINLFSLSTRYEEIIKFFLYIFKNKSCYLFQEIIFMLLLGTNFLDTISRKFVNLVVANKIRRTNSNNNINMLIIIRTYYLMFAYILLCFHDQIRNLSSALYSRNINVLYCIQLKGLS